MMDKKIIAIISIFLLLFAPINEKTHGKKLESTIIVDDEGDGDFTNIQEAVNHAKDGDVILVYSGIYNESVKIENKSIEIKGIPYELGKGNDTGKPVIVARDIAVKIHGNNCSIENFTVKGGIEIYGFHNRISNNEIADCELGIRIKHGKENIIYCNNITNAQYGGIVTHFSPFTIIQHNTIRNSGGGIAVWDNSKKTEIIENNIINCNYGISIGGAPSINVLIKHNNLINNSRQAYFENAYFCTWYENYWSNWHIPLPKPIFGTIGGVIIWWIFGIVIPWIQFDWHPLMQPYEWWKE